MVATDILHQPEGAGTRRRRVVGGAVALSALLCAACPTVDLGDDPVEPGVCRPDPDYFRTRIWPEFLAQPDMAKTCVGRSGCHGEADGRSALRLDNTDPIDFTRNYQIVTRFLNCGTPEASSIFTKPLAGEDPHGGGDLFGATDPAAAVFLAWFAQ